MECLRESIFCNSVEFWTVTYGLSSHTINVSIVWMLFKDIHAFYTCRVKFALV